MATCDLFYWRVFSTRLQFYFNLKKLGNWHKSTDNVSGALLLPCFSDFRNQGERDIYSCHVLSCEGRITGKTDWMENHHYYNTATEKGCLYVFFIGWLFLENETLSTWYMFQKRSTFRIENIEHLYLKHLNVGQKSDAKLLIIWLLSINCLFRVPIRPWILDRFDLWSWKTIIRYHFLNRSDISV